MQTLHILNKSPDHPRFRACLEAVLVDDALVLTENAVLGLTMAQTALPPSLYAITTDIDARGLQGLLEASSAQSIDYPALVALTEAAQRIISW